MKKSSNGIAKAIVAVASAAVLALALAGCGSQGAASSASSSSADGEVGMANPWTDAATAEEAAQGAGFGAFSVPVDVAISLGTPVSVEYSYMEGIAEADLDYGAAMLRVRKSDVPSEDISGDYNTYANAWTQDVNGIDVACEGAAEGAAQKTTWTTGGCSYSIGAIALGGNDDFGISADDLAALVIATY